MLVVTWQLKINNGLPFWFWMAGVKFEFFVVKNYFEGTKDLGIYLFPLKRKTFSSLIQLVAQQFQALLRAVLPTKRPINKPIRKIGEVHLRNILYLLVPLLFLHLSSSPLHHLLSFPHSKCSSEGAQKSSSFLRAPNRALSSYLNE